MKVITAHQFENTIANILHDEKELAKVKGEQFNGVAQDRLNIELRRRLGDGWTLKENQPVKFNKTDVAAVANSRFYRKTGMKLLMAWAIIIMAFAIIALTYHLMPLWAFYLAGIVVTAGFVFVFSKKQKVMRDELTTEVYGSDEIEANR